MANAQEVKASAAFLTGGGEMGAAVRAHDWSTSPLGSPGTWPQALRSAVQICLNTPVVCAVHWGPDLCTIYNDAYVPALAERHPWALGQPFSAVWAEIWDVLGLQIASVLKTGQGFSTDHQLLRMHRNGRFEDTYWIYSFAPLHGDGMVVGIFVTALDTTDKVVAERRLTEAQEHQRQMLRQMPGFVCTLTGPDLVYTYVNDAYVAISERTDFVGRRFRDVFADVEGQGFFETFEHAFQTGEGVVLRGMAFRLRGRDEPQYVDFVLEPIRDEAGTVTGLFVGGYETTEIHRSNQALRESEARYRTLFDAIDTGFCVFEVIFDECGKAVDYRFLETNPAFERQSGLVGAVGRCIREFAPDLEEIWFERYGRVALTGESFRVEDEAAALGRWFDINAFRTGPPEQCRVAVLFNDMTGRRRAEERLRELNETLEARVTKQVAERNLLATLVETTDVMIMAADLDYNILAINKANADEFERIYGIRPEVGDNMLALLADQPEHQEQVRAGWGRGLAGEETTFVEDYGDPGRTRPYYEVKFRTLRNEAGDPIGTYQFVTDVTERLREQAQLAEAQEALRQSQKMEAMGSLTGGVAHDFNNLLTPIIGSLDMLVRKGVGSERERRLIDGALQSAERAKTLVQRLLAFARRQPLQPTAVDITRLVESMTGLISSTLGPTVDVRVELEPDLPSARADQNQLEMALLNLAVNARDAMPNGGELTIAATRESVSGGHKSGVRRGHYVRLCVTDSGVGMDEATLARAVEPFFSTKGIGKGTGLGLSMVHGLAAQLGGGLTIDSVPGRGASVELWLPISATAVDDGVVSASAPQTRPGRGIALLVDDEELVRMSTADMLVDLGFEVVEAGSADQAMHLIHEGTLIDLLVTDHLMPGMSGADLAREARTARPSLPVLIVSGYAEVEGIAPELPRLTKPFRSVELAASLAALMPEASA